MGSGVDDAASFMATKYRDTLDGAANEFLCPITQELPVEPVTAMDGKVYERKAIEDWFRHGNGNSPMTNQPMSTTLLPATHVRNSLELMVKSGALTGEKVDAWQKKLKEEESMAKLLEKAQAGDHRAMGKLAFKYEKQSKFTDAIAWFRRGADAGSMACLSDLGRFHLYGVGMDEKQPGVGLVMVTEAAVSGIQHACWQLGRYFKKGFPRRAAGDLAAGSILEKDEAQAAKWFRKMAVCDEVEGVHLKAAVKQEALDWLRQYDEAQAAAAAGGAAAE